MTLTQSNPHTRAVPQVHCLFAGVDHVLFPELINSPVPLSNARGLFSSSLAEYSILVRGVDGNARARRAFGSLLVLIYNHMRRP